MSARALPIAWYRRLDVRLAFVTLAGTGIVGLLLLSWIERGTQHRMDAFAQWNSLHLAEYIADRQQPALIDARGRLHPEAMHDIGMYISRIQPSLEAYLLDRNGTIVGSSKRDRTPRLQRVDLRRVFALLEHEAPVLPIYGDDPNTPDRLNLVSIARLPSRGPVHGYLYVVLNGEDARLVQQTAAHHSQRLFSWTWAVGIVIVCGLAVVLAQRRIVCRLHNLAMALHAFRQPDGQPLPRTPQDTDEIDLVATAAHALRTRVQEQFLRIEADERQRRELIHNIAHDLRSPLTCLQNHLESALRSAPGPAAPSGARGQEYLETALRQCHRLGRWIGQLFELSSLDTIEARIEAFRIDELLNDVVFSYQAEAARHGATLRLCVPGDAAMQALGDPGLIERVLQNLIDNALRHAGRGGWIEASCFRVDARIHVSVRDTGPGIAESDLAHIFDRYWTTRRPATGMAPAQQRSHRDAGLGLAIVRRILETHGSAIHVHSRPAQGCTFTFSLPAIAGC